MILDTPIEYRQHQGYLEVKHEEDALCWFWAFPHLMPWPRPILWLYTPVVGNKNWPGDLWGIDSQGELLIVECKKCKRSDDPFIDFVPFHESGRPELSAEHWKWKFQKHLKAELAFSDCLTERPKKKTDGILPRSNKRKHIQRWPKLGRIIDDYIRSPEYKDHALHYLQIRAGRHDPTPFYLALMVVSNSKSPIISERAIASGRKLQQMVGSDHVRVITVIGAFLRDNKVRIAVKEIPLG
jgi:hypothetical protein